MAVKVHSDLPLEATKLKNAALLLRAVNHKLRQDMLHLIHKKKSMTVTEIYVKLRLEQSVASQHLAILRKANVVNTVREGKYIYYSINYDWLSHIQKTADKMINGK